MPRDPQQSPPAAHTTHDPAEPLPAADLSAWARSLTADHRRRIDRRLEILETIQDGLRRPAGEKPSLKRLCRAHGISRGTYYRWRRAYHRYDLYGLRDRRCGHTGTKLSEQQKTYIAELIKTNPDRRVTRIYEYLRRRHPDPAVSGATVHRYVARWKRENHALLQHLRNPDQWKSLYQAAHGDAAERAAHALHYVELDSTPADVICADGKRYTLIGAIDIYSRQAAVHVAPVSSSAGIAEVLRHVILRWGIPDHLITDNGKDYTSHHIRLICGRLEVDQILVAPFSPESKPFIERFFGTLSRSLLEELPGYIGHNVADRKAIESRRSFAQRYGTGKPAIRVDLTADELQATINRWLEKIYAQRIHRGLGESPEHRMAQSPVAPRKLDDERLLDILLLPAGEAVVGKKGIRYRDAWYQAPDLAGWIRDRVEVRRDLADAGRLYVFDLEGRYITTAWDPTLEGMPAIDYEAMRREQRRRLRAQRDAIETLRDEPMLDHLAEPGGAPLQSLPRRRTARSDSIESARDAALQRRGIKPDHQKSVADWLREEKGLPPLDPEDTPRMTAAELAEIEAMLPPKKIEEEPEPESDGEWEYVFPEEGPWYRVRKKTINE